MLFGHLSSRVSPTTLYYQRKFGDFFDNKNSWNRIIILKSPSYMGKNFWNIFPLLACVKINIHIYPHVLPRIWGCPRRWLVPSYWATRRRHMTLALPLWVNCRQGGWRGDWRRYYSSKNLLVNSIRTNTLSLISNHVFGQLVSSSSGCLF